MSRASVVITSYNHGDFLSDAIESSLAQTHPCEVVVVDDGSTDDTSKVLEAYGDRVIGLVQSNAGQGTAISRGIAEATGEVLLLLDADDIVEPTRVERVLNELDQHPEAMWVRHGLRLADFEGRTLDEPLLYMVGSDPRADVVTRGRTAGTTSVLAIRRDLWDLIGPIPSVYTGYADVYLLIAAALTAPHAHISEPLTIRRLHQGQHFTINSTDRKRQALFHIQLRAHAARDAARVAQVVGDLPEVASKETWWQLRAELDLAKVEGHLRLGALTRLVFILVGRLARAPLPGVVRFLAVVRAIVLAVTPHALFPTLWWRTNEGRRSRHQAA